MRKTEILLLLDYMYWVNHRLLDAASELAPEDPAESSPPTVRDLRATLVHELDVEWSWRLKLQARSDEDEAELSPEDYPDVAAIRDRWAIDEAEMREWLDSMTDSELAEEVELEFTPDHRPLWLYLVHIVTHAGQQQADAATLLSRAGRSPGELGFLKYLSGLPRD